MNSNNRIVRPLVAIAIIVMVSVSAGVLFLAAPLATGYVAKYLCSSTFVSKRNPEKVFTEDVGPLLPFMPLIDYHIDTAEKTLAASLFNQFKREAVYREECGCTLVVGATKDKIRSQQFAGSDVNSGQHQPPADLPWPDGGGKPVDPAGLGLNRQLIEKAIDQAFAEPEAHPKRNTRAVVIVYKGQLVAERYAPGIDKDMPLLGWSMAKSILNALVGIAVKEGRLDVLEPAPVPEWKNPNDDRRRITLDHLLCMTDGLAFKEIYLPLFDVTRMLYDSEDVAAYAIDTPLKHPPGTRWSYSSGTANIIARIVRQSLEEQSPDDNAGYLELIHEKLFKRIGMTSAVMELDPSGTIIGSSYALATPRDWAKFGQLYLDDGIRQDERILPQGWVAYTTTPTPCSERGEYGALFWLNAGAKDDHANRRWPNAPTDTFAALGFQDQCLIIIPSKQLVLVRFGATMSGKAWSTDQLIQDVLKATAPSGFPISSSATPG